MQRRRKGSGTIFRKADGVWVARVTLPAPRGEVKRRQATSTLFCTAARKLTEMQPYRPEFATPMPPRVVAMQSARELGRHTAGEWHALVRSVERRCYYCGVTCFTVRGGRWHLTKDHKVPVTRGGSDAIDNLVVACRRCNSEKCDMTAEEFIELCRPGAWVSA